MTDSSNRYCIIGNGVAGTNAAETICKQDSSAKVTLLGSEPYPLYNRVALPPFLKLAASREKVIMRSKVEEAEKGIDLRLETEVTRVDTDAQVVYTRDGDEIPYNKLLIATGGHPNGLQVPGGDAAGVFNFQTLDDAQIISDHVEKSQSAVVVGGSFIAYELAEAFHKRGLETTWLIRGDRFLRRVLEDDGGHLVDQIASDHGVRMLYGEEVAEIHTKGGVAQSVTTTGGRHIEADLVGIGVGLTLNTSFLTETPIELSKGILTNEFLETSIPSVFAAGDIAEYFDVTLRQNNLMGTWDNASNHGRIAGKNMMGAREPYRQIPTYTSGLFNSKITSMGTTPEVMAGLDTAHAIDLEARKYRRLFFHKDRLVGAVLIGDRRGKRELKELIRTNEVVPDEKRKDLIEIK